MNNRIPKRMYAIGEAVKIPPLVQTRSVAFCEMKRRGNIFVDRKVIITAKEGIEKCTLHGANMLRAEIKT